MFRINLYIDLIFIRLKHHGCIFIENEEIHLNRWYLVLVLDQESSCIFGFFFRLTGKTVKAHDMTPYPYPFGLLQIDLCCFDIRIFFNQFNNALIS